ncbi:MAG: hypothetical protein ACNA7W_18610 [Pseudomonadales bacterium]
MKPFVALVRREWWEHQAGFLWTPLVICGLMVLIALPLLAGGEADVSVSFERQQGTHTERQLHQWDQGLLGLLDVSAWSSQQIAERSAQSRHLVARPFQLVHLLVAIFVLLGALHDERKDRSVLFYKSLPISDGQTVASKLVLAVWVAPLVTVAAVVFTQLALLLMISAAGAMRGASGVASLWQQAGLLRGALELLFGYLLQGLWTLPVYAWLLLVSAAAPRVPLLWAALIPLLLVVLEAALLGSATLRAAIVDHLAFRALPRPPPWFGGEGQAGVGLPEQLALLLQGELWLGLAIAVGFLAATVWFRQRNAEL